MSFNAKMTAIADKIRALLGITGKMGLDSMNSNLGTAVDECDSQASLIQQIKEELKGKAAGGGGSDLPAGYHRVDYIELNGEQLVDTGIIGNQNTQIRASFTWGNDKQNHLFGCSSSGNTASITSYMNGSWRFGPKSATKTIQKNNNDLPYHVLLNKSVIGVTSSSTVISDVPDFETIATLLLGGARNSDGGLPASGLVGRVFEFRVWDGDTPVMEMIPVTDGTVFRFWDAVSKTFFDSITDTPLNGGNL